MAESLTRDSKARFGDRVADYVFEGTHAFRTLPNAQRFDYAGLEGRLLSSSYTPPAGDPARAPMLAALSTLFDEHQENGEVVVLYHTEVHAGTLGSRVDG